MPQAVFVVAQNGFQDQEFSIPYEALKQSNWIVKIASQARGIAVGKFGQQVEVELSLNQIKEYDVLIFIGGPGALDFQKDSEAHRLAQEAVQKGKLLCAICIAPTILAYAGVLKGKQATVWNGDGMQGRLLEEQGAKFVDQSTVVDDNIITANGPQSAEEFAQTILNTYYYENSPVKAE